MSNPKEKIEEVILRIKCYTQLLKTEINNEIILEQRNLKNLKYEVYKIFIHNLESDLENGNIPGSSLIERNFEKACHEYIACNFCGSERLEKIGLEHYPIQYRFYPGNSTVTKVKEMILSGGINLGFFKLFVPESRQLLNQLMQAAPKHNYVELKQRPNLKTPNDSLFNHCLYVIKNDFKTLIDAMNTLQHYSGSFKIARQELNAMGLNKSDIKKAPNEPLMQHCVNALKKDYTALQDAIKVLASYGGDLKEVSKKLPKAEQNYQTNYMNSLETLISNHENQQETISYS